MYLTDLNLSRRCRSDVWFATDAIAVINDCLMMTAGVNSTGATTMREGLDGFRGPVAARETGTSKHRESSSEFVFALAARSSTS